MATQSQLHGEVIHHVVLRVGFRMHLLLLLLLRVVVHVVRVLLRNTCMVMRCMRGVVVHLLLLLHGGCIRGQRHLLVVVGLGVVLLGVLLCSCSMMAVISLWVVAKRARGSKRSSRQR